MRNTNSTLDKLLTSSGKDLGALIDEELKNNYEHAIDYKFNRDFICGSIFAYTKVLEFLGRQFTLVIQEEVKDKNE